MAGSEELQPEDGQKTAESANTFLKQVREQKQDATTLHKIDLTQQAKELLDLNDIGGIFHYLEARGIERQFIQEIMRNTRTEYGDFGEKLSVKDYLTRRAATLQRDAEHFQGIVLRSGNHQDITEAYEGAKKLLAQREETLLLERI